ncbi:Uridine kinase [Taphrina deformans PYCC 5710]|uniref:Uridine kinase n=1 Tax=Taphrina deformans (strain PYCC 5710 / ATCC 11124 / CBS 356.35 / IMI 108563 / JCM 9778 / NBRC 8474) TaxID=1097556 RepID=R4XCY4_TAPDE|nr:Uridine kinase [Taphrina deformans PYCC 5710]|eukprot:CCG81185.1 Uridine kinase [Taphrina deformans PYCC 5710]
MSHSYRPPWLALHFVGIAGGSGSGKSTFVANVIEELNVPWVVVISLDSFYKVLTKEQSELAFKSQYDFDHPDALDWDLLFEILRNLKSGKRVEIPIYDFSTHARKPNKTVPLYGANVIILEGIFALHDPRILDLLDMKVYLDTDTEQCFQRRLKRDIEERGRDRQGIIDQYETFVKPNFHKFVKTQSDSANVITTGTKAGQATLHMIVDHIQEALTRKSEEHRKNLSDLRNSCEDKCLPETVHILTQTNQVRGIHSIIRDKDTKRDDYVFYLERLTTLIMEAAVGNLLPHRQKTVETKVGVYTGLEMAAEVCGITIVRGGEIFERSLRMIFRDCPMGKILIQSDPRTGEPRLHYLKLPSDTRTSFVLLFDAQIATGQAAIMSVRILLDHGISQDRIIFISCLAAPIGVKTLATLYPKLHIYCGALDDGLVGLSNYINPGAGNIGLKYFGA